MNIHKRLQIEFEFLGKEQISANTALKIINDVFKEAENEQLTIGDVSSSVTDWLSEEYSREEAEEQVSNAVIRKAQVYVIEYETGMEDIIEFKNGDIKHLNPR